MMFFGRHVCSAVPCFNDVPGVPDLFDEVGCQHVHEVKLEVKLE